MENTLLDLRVQRAIHRLSRRVKRSLPSRQVRDSRFRNITVVADHDATGLLERVTQMQESERESGFFQVGKDGNMINYFVLDGFDYVKLPSDEVAKVVHTMGGELNPLQYSLRVEILNREGQRLVNYDVFRNSEIVVPQGGSAILYGGSQNRNHDRRMELVSSMSGYGEVEHIVEPHMQIFQSYARITVRDPHWLPNDFAASELSEIASRYSGRVMVQVGDQGNIGDAKLAHTWVTRGVALGSSQVVNLYFAPSFRGCSWTPVYRGIKKAITKPLPRNK